MNMLKQNRPLKSIRRKSIRQYCSARNKILIIRNYGGLGDILMHRMIFEDIKRVIPDAEVHFACPNEYYNAVIDHPYLDKFIEINQVDKSQYVVWYNTSKECNVVEVRNAPNHSPHRSDIWASVMNLKLENHNMHFRISDKEKDIGRSLIVVNSNRIGPTVLIFPTSAMRNKNLLDEHVVQIYHDLLSLNFNPIVVHNEPLSVCKKHQLNSIVVNNIRNWMGLIHEADYVISVDTSAFHCAGGMGKPVLGIFTFANGNSYGQYYDKAAIHQGHCPLGYNGCYNWCKCPELKNRAFIPCHNNLKAEEIIKSFINLTDKFPSK